jgi:hypothetical protein
MTTEQRKLISDLIMWPDGKRRISPEEFADRFPEALDGGKVALWVLDKAEHSRSAEDIESAITVGSVFGFSAEHCPVLCRLLEAEWHQCHEAIVSVLQKLKDSRAVDALYKAAFVKHEYLAYDTSFGFARKCTWALADTGTADALEKLRLLAKSENPQIAGYAQRRVDNWDREQERKRA